MSTPLRPTENYADVAGVTDPILQRLFIRLIQDTAFLRQELAKPVVLDYDSLDYVRIRQELEHGGNAELRVEALRGVLADGQNQADQLNRFINTAFPLAGGGKLDHDLTLTISDFVGSGLAEARGTVPTPGGVDGTTHFLRADATWALVGNSLSLPLTFPGPNGSSMILDYNDELITINAFETDSAANLLPTDSLILAVVGRVTTNLVVDAAPALSWNLSDPTTNARFMDANTNVAAGSTGVGIKQWRGVINTTAAGPTQEANDVIRIRVNPPAGAVYSGAVRVVVFYLQAVPPTS